MTALEAFATMTTTQINNLREHNVPGIGPVLTDVEIDPMLTIEATAKCKICFEAYVPPISNKKYCDDCGFHVKVLYNQPAIRKDRKYHYRWYTKKDTNMVIFNAWYEKNKLVLDDILKREAIDKSRKVAKQRKTA